MSSYGCLMAPLPEPLAKRVIALGQALPDDRIDPEDGRETSPHITVKYGFDGVDPQEIIRAMKGWPPIRVRIGRTSVFHGDGSVIVLKLGVSGQDLVRMNHFVSRQFECVDTHPTYRPHATISYLEKDETDPYYYREFFTDELDGEEVVINELEYSTADNEMYRIPLNGTDMGKQAYSMLDVARELLKGE